MISKIAIGSIVTVIYAGVFEKVPTGEEYIKDVPVYCLVVDKTIPFRSPDGLSEDYGHVKLNCSQGMTEHYLVTKHHLNNAIIWVPSDRLYNLTEIDQEPVKKLYKKAKVLPRSSD